jgi:hypothetical protein
MSCNNEPAKPKGELVVINYPDRGDFQILYQLFPPTSDAKTVIDELRRDKIVSNIVNQLNSIFKLPQDVIIRFRYSDTVNAWYDPYSRSIDFTSAFIINFYNNFAQYYQGQELIGHVTNVITFFLLHEVGHALIDIYKLSVKGPEEDMADYFSIYLLSQGDDIIQQAALDGADMFFEYGRGTENATLGSLPLWDEHSLSQQRFYNIICLMYGSNPAKYSYFLTKNLLPADKSDGCIAEYPKVIRGWETDLRFYMQQPAKQ